jgi:hypothetical protein
MVEAVWSLVRARISDRTHARIDRRAHIGPVRRRVTVGGPHSPGTP